MAAGLSGDRARVGVAVAFLAHAVVFGTWASRVPAVKHALGLSDAQLGVAFFGMAAGTLIGSRLGGALASRIGAWRVVRAGMPVLAAALVARRRRRRSGDAHSRARRSGHHGGRRGRRDERRGCRRGAGPRPAPHVGVPRVLERGAHGRRGGRDRRSGARPPPGRALRAGRGRRRRRIGAVPGPAPAPLDPEPHGRRRGRVVPEARRARPHRLLLVLRRGSGGRLERRLPARPGGRGRCCCRRGVRELLAGDGRLPARGRSAGGRLRPGQARPCGKRHGGARPRPRPPRPDLRRGPARLRAPRGGDRTDRADGHQRRRRGAARDPGRRRFPGLRCRLRGRDHRPRRDRVHRGSDRPARRARDSGLPHRRSSRSRRDGSRRPPAAPDR